MKASVRAAFVDFSKQFEGCLREPYLDYHHDAAGNLDPLVTIAIGNLIDPLSLCVGIPFLNDADESPCTWAEIEAGWHRVKARKDLASHGGGAFKGIAGIHLSDDGIAEVVGRKLDDVDRSLARRFDGYADLWPADATLAAISMAWAMGAGAFAKYPRFCAAVNDLDFCTAAAECWIGPKLVRGDDGKAVPAPPGTPVSELVPDPRNPGVHPRNLANVHLLENAERVISLGADLEELHYPDSLLDPATDPVLPVA